MHIETLNTITAIRITEAPGLDPITLTFQDDGPGAGRLTVECYGQAWTAYWGGMGENNTVRLFVASSEPGYLKSKLMSGRETRQGEAYLLRVCEAIVSALKQ